MTTDGSTFGIGAILSQSQKGDKVDERVIAYTSRTLRGPEEWYAATHVEALVVVWAMHHFWYYLAGRKFILYTDHAALTYIFNNEKPGTKVARWATALMEYDFEVRYRAGTDNPADALSRLV